MDVDIAQEQLDLIANRVLVETAIAGAAQANRTSLSLLNIVR